MAVPHGNCLYRAPISAFSARKELVFFCVTGDAHLCLCLKSSRTLYLAPVLGGERERGKKKRVKGAKGRSLSLVGQRPEMLAVLLYQCDRGTEKGSGRKTSTSTFLFLILSKQPGQANDVNSIKIQ